MEKEQVLEFLKAEGNAGFLQENGFTTEVEKIVEVAAPLTTESVESFLKSNQGAKDKIYNENVTTFMKKKLGLETVTPDLLGKEIMFKDEIETFKKAAVKATVSNSVEYPDLVLGAIDYSKINFEGEELKGIHETLEDLKGKFPKLFNTTPGKPNTPPAPKTGTKEITKEQFNKMSYTEKAALYSENKELYENLTR